MWVITPSTVRQWARERPDVSEALLNWLKAVKRADWKDLMDVRSVYSHADGVEVDSGRAVTVFNIGGGKYRLITAIHYNTRRIFTLMLLTHAEYDKEKWKRQL
jgi:mRNA interferase HigB